MNTRRSGTRWLAHTILVLGSLAMLYPLLWMLSSSFKPQDIIFAQKGLIPTEITLENYGRGWDGLAVPFSRFFLNSFIIAGARVLGTMISCSMTAYAFARLDFRFKRPTFVLMLMTILLPGHVTVIPEYILFNTLGWVNTFYPLTVPSFFAVNGFFVFLNVQFMRGIPTDLDAAAMVDGASKWQIYWRIVLPLSTPALITTAIFTFIWSWGDFFSQLLYLSDIRLFTVPLALQLFLDSTGESSFGPLFAMSILSLLPTFVFFIVAQRYLVEGISTTGFKG